jgi:hypothetical protein
LSSGLSTYLEQQLLDFVFSGQSYSPPATLYFGLMTARGTNTQAANNVGFTEVAVGSYGRVGVTANLTNLLAATGGNPAQKLNGTTITFPTATADWGTVIAVCIFDASSGGNLLAWGDLFQSLDVLDGDTVSFGFGQVIVTLQ